MHRPSIETRRANACDIRINTSVTTFPDSNVIYDFIIQTFARGRLSITKFSNVDKRPAERYKNSFFPPLKIIAIIHEWKKKKKKIHAETDTWLCRALDLLVISLLIWLCPSIIRSINVGLNNHPQSLPREEVSRSNANAIMQRTKLMNKVSFFFIKRYEERFMWTLHISFARCVLLSIYKEKKAARTSKKFTKFWSNKEARKYSATKIWIKSHENI